MSRLGIVGITGVEPSWISSVTRRSGDDGTGTPLLSYCPTTGWGCGRPHRTQGMNNLSSTRVNHVVGQVSDDGETVGDRNNELDLDSRRQKVRSFPPLWDIFELYRLLW